MNNIRREIFISSYESVNATDKTFGISIDTKEHTKTKGTGPLQFDFGVSSMMKGFMRYTNIKYADSWFEGPWQNVRRTQTYKLWKYYT